MASTALRIETTGLLPPRAQADGTLRRLQETALVLFADRGYHGVSMRDLAGAAGVGASSVYGHVASKEALLLDLVLLAHDEHREGLRQALLETDVDPGEQLRAVVQAHVRMHATYPMLAIVANNELHALSEGARRSVLAVRGDAEGTITSIIERGVRLGVFAPGDPWLATAAIGGMGIRVASWYRPGNGYEIDDVCREYALFALRLVAWSGFSS